MIMQHLPVQTCLAPRGKCIDIESQRSSILLVWCRCPQ